MIIPHAGGKDLLIKCLESLTQAQGVAFEVIIVDNGLVSDVDEDVIGVFPRVQILRFKGNIGFASACNRGVEASRGEFVFLLNNDAEIGNGSLQILVNSMRSDIKVACCQPKILSLIRGGYFDYSSAAGGDIDRLGYPFARGRVFDVLEYDNGQYDDEHEIFWGAGAALMIRRELYLRAGGLAEWFFAHMEEIDLQWRFLLMGYKIKAVPRAVAYHRGAVTIKSGSFRKHYLNHRNNLAMLLRNYGTANLVRYLPLRLVLDLVLAGYSIVMGDVKRFWAVVLSIFWFFSHIPFLLKARKQVQHLRLVKDHYILQIMYSRSVVWQYFVRGKKYWFELRNQ